MSVRTSDSWRWAFSILSSKGAISFWQHCDGDVDGDEDGGDYFQYSDGAAGTTPKAGHEALRKGRGNRKES